MHKCKIPSTKTKTKMGEAAAYNIMAGEKYVKM
jgi:hypothetical protein